MMPEGTARQMVTPDMGEQKRARKSAANAPCVIPEVKIPQCFDGHFGDFVDIPATPHPD
jgi:hypothetical protein